MYKKVLVVKDIAQKSDCNNYTKVQMRQTGPGVGVYFKSKTWTLGDLTPHLCRKSKIYYRYKYVLYYCQHYSTITLAQLQFDASRLITERHTRCIRMLQMLRFNNAETTSRM